MRFSHCFALKIFSVRNVKFFIRFSSFVLFFSHLKTIAYGPLCRAAHICIYSYIYKYTSIHLSIASYRLYECVYFECLTVWQKCCFLLLLCVWLFIGGNGRQKSKKAMPNQTEESPTTSPKKMPAPHFPALFPPNQSATPRVWGIWPARVEITYIYSTYISPPFLILFCSNIFFFFLSDCLGNCCRYFQEREKFFHCDDGWNSGQKYIE